MNELGHVAIWEIHTAGEHAVLWSPDGNTIYDLQDALPADSGWQLSGAKKINSGTRKLTHFDNSAQEDPATSED